MGVATAAKFVLPGPSVLVPVGSSPPEAEEPPSVPVGLPEGVDSEPLVIWEPLPVSVPEALPVPVVVGAVVMVGPEVLLVSVLESSPPPPVAVAENLTQAAEPADCAASRSLGLVHAAIRHGATSAAMAAWDAQAQAWSVQLALAMAEPRQEVLRETS